MADPALEQLLAVQDLDTRATQLRTKRAGLPERAEAEALGASLAALDARLATLDGERHRLDREQARLEDEISTLKDKSAHADGLMYGGNVTNPRELQSLQDEVAALARRISELEDNELEILVEREPLDAEAETARTEREGLVAQAEEVAARITVAEAEIDAELAETLAARAAAVTGVPEDLLAEYEQLRTANGGIGVARLEHGTTCGGCRIQLSAVERDRIRGLPDDARIHCEECARLLVR